MDQRKGTENSTALARKGFLDIFLRTIYACEPPITAFFNELD
jgi:hypothetical protein